MLDIAFIVWVILIVLTIVALGQCPTDGHGRRHLVSANGIFIITFALYFVIPALNPLLTEGQFYWAVMYSDKTMILVVMCSLVWAILLYLLGYQISSISSKPALRSTSHIRPTKSPDDRRAIMVAIILVVVGVMMKLLAVQLGGGVEETVMRMSKGVSENQNLSVITSIVGHLRNFSGISEAGAAYLLLQALRGDRMRWLAISVFVVVVALAMLTTGKRLYILWPVLIAVCGFSCYVKTILPRHFFLILPLGLTFGFLTLMYRIYAPLYFAGLLASFDLASVSWAQGSYWLFYFNSLEFSFFELTAAAFADRESITNILGGPLLAAYRPYIEPFLYIIPRSVWLDKPETLLDVSHAMSALVFGTDISLSTFGIASGLTGTSYVLGGAMGYTIAFLTFGFFCRRIDVRYISTRNYGEDVHPMRIVWLAFWIVVAFHIFRQGTLGWVFIITVVQQIGVLIGFFAISSMQKLRWNSAPRRLHHA